MSTTPAERPAIPTGPKSYLSLLIDLLKVILWPVVVVFLLTCNQSPVKKIAAAIAKRAADSSTKFTGKAGPVEITLEQQVAKEILAKKDSVANTPVPVKELAMISVVRPPENIVKETKVLDKSNPDAHTWVYLGQKTATGLINCHFIIKDLPVQGQRIVARDAVYKRESFPVLLPSGEYQLGKSVGVVADNEAVTVVEVKQIPDDNNYWALVR